MKVGDIVRRRGKRSLATLQYKPRESGDYYDELGLIISIASSTTNAISVNGSSMFNYTSATVKWTRSGTLQEMDFILEIVQEI
jgi:hypothetical protein